MSPKANLILGAFHRIRRKDVAAGGSPTIAASLARMGA